MEEKRRTEDNKQKIRLDAKDKRDALSETQAAQWSAEICMILEGQPFFKDARTVYFYYPLGNEVNLLPLAQKALDMGKQAAFPRVAGSSMEFYQVASLKDFAEGAFHLMEPIGCDKMHAADALVFVPGLAFDAHGSRMGYGKGYYDRYFARYPGCRKIGICYNMQLALYVPCGAYDIPMEAVVTERGAIFV